MQEVQPFLPRMIKFKCFIFFVTKKQNQVTMWKKEKNWKKITNQYLLYVQMFVWGNGWKNGVKKYCGGEIYFNRKQNIKWDFLYVHHGTTLSPSFCLYLSDFTPKVIINEEGNI